MKKLILISLVVLVGCGKGNEPSNPAPETTFSGQVGNVSFSATNSMDPVADKARVEAAIKLSK